MKLKFVLSETSSSSSAKSSTQTTVDGGKVVLIEKYLKISDFLKYIIENKEIFIEKMLQNIKNKSEETDTMMSYIMNFLLKIQDSIDFDTVCKVILECKLSSFITQELFDQREDSFKYK